MAESIISDIYNTVRNKLRDEGTLLLGVPEEASKMKNTLESIEAVLASAEKKEVTDDAVKLWLRDLKDVAYDIEDVLEDWSIAQLQMQDESAGTSQQQGLNPKGKVCCSCIPTPCFGLKQVKSRHHIAHDIKAINERLDAIAKRKNEYGLDGSSVSVKEIAKEESTPFHFIHAVPSQEKTKATVIEKLVQDDFKNVKHIPIVSLVGMGGIGKTTLANMVHDDKNVKAHFSKIIWVCVSDNFSQIKVANAIADALELNVTNPQNLTNVLSKIADSIKENDTFLLILDDVWENDEKKWDAILSCMGKGDAQRSRILLTTRSSDLAEKMEAVFTLPVEELSEEDSWSLFSYYAFSGKAKEDCGTVEDIAKELAKKCKGLPLALEVLGKFMRTKKIRRLEWKDVLTSKIWETTFKEDVFPSLILSYLDLPSTVKRCFTFCSIFPKDTVMKKSRLIHLWMAQGYLRGSTTKLMEVDGEDYFEFLVRRSFFRVIEPHRNHHDRFPKIYNPFHDFDHEYDPFHDFDHEYDPFHDFDHEGDTEVMIHDLVHDFAQYASNGEIAIWDPSPEVQEVSGRAKPRHLAFGGEIGESMSLPTSFDIKALRTLFLSTHPTTILEKLCADKSSVRALDIYFSFDPETSRASKDIHFSTDPKCALKDIRRLVHLRYLCLNSSELIVLPEEICDLRYLQTLDLKGCSLLKKLPTEIGRLTALRHLLFDNKGRLDSLPKGLGKLKLLQTLSCFFPKNLQGENCCNLEDLSELHNLRGDLWIKNLSQVAHVSEATRAKLSSKAHIVRLAMEFGYGDALLQSNVLEALKPAEDGLECLMIKGYRGAGCPRWIGQLSCLKEIQLKKVSVDCLPALGILPNLQKLKIESAYKLKHVGDEFLGISDQNEVFFRSLTELTFEYLSQWENWEGPQQRIMRSRVTIMPSLRNLTLSYCNKLQALPHFLENVPLEKLDAIGVSLPAVHSGMDDCPERLCIGDVVLPRTLKYIEVHTVGNEYCMIYETAASEVMVQQQQLLRFNYMLISGFKKLHDLVRRSMVALTTVKDMQLTRVHDEFLPPLGLMPFLEELIISEARQVKKVGNEFLGMNYRGLGIGNYDEHKGGDRGRAFIAFPRLKSLSLCYFYEWEEWEDPQVEGVDDQINIMPFLCKLNIILSKLRSLPRFLESVPLQKLHIIKDEMPRIRHIEDEGWKMSTILAQNLQKMELATINNAWVPDWRNYCVNLKVLTLSTCRKASLLGLGALPSLEELKVQNLIEGGDTPTRRQSQQSSSSSCNTSMVFFPRLRILAFDRFVCWEELLGEFDWGSGDIRYGTNRAITIMPRLQELSIVHCSKTNALPNFLQKVSLQRLHISDCGPLETWWEKEAGEDWLNWKSKISQVEITKR